MIPRTARVFVAGHRGLVGSALVRRLEGVGFSNVLTASRDELDLRDQSEVSHWFKAAALHKTLLDELPQCWQVVTGKFSLVGPRPVTASIVERMSSDVAESLHSVRAGATGPWQMSIDDGSLLDDTCDYDLAYARLSSLRVDVVFTIWTTLQAIGASEKSRRWVIDVVRAGSDGPRAHCPARPASTPGRLRSIATRRRRPCCAPRTGARVRTTVTSVHEDLATLSDVCGVALLERIWTKSLGIAEPKIASSGVAQRLPVSCSAATTISKRGGRPCGSLSPSRSAAPNARSATRARADLDRLIH